MLRSAQNIYVPLIIAVFLSIPMSTNAAAPADTISSNQIPTAAPIEGDLAGKGAEMASKAVYRIVCQQGNSQGTGFLHKSGKLLTASHVVNGCSEVLIISASGDQNLASVTAADEDLDLALLTPKTPISTPGLALSGANDLPVGTQVATWGFPGGYGGFAPLLTMGNVSGLQAFKLPDGRIVRRLVINAAFNQGNSGGPLLDFKNGEVIGVVDSKLAPITPFAASAFQALADQQSGFQYQATRSDGTKVNLSEGKVVGMIMEELRSQVQLVIGYAVLGENLRDFLKTQHVEP